MRLRNSILAIAIGNVLSHSAFAILAVPGSGNGYGQPCAGQTQYGAQPCYPAAYIPTFAEAVKADGSNNFKKGLQPDYFGSVGNYANSPLPDIQVDGSVTGGLRKFVDVLPDFGKPNANGMELVVAIPDVTTYLGAPVAAQPQDGIEYASDYYEIAVVQYTAKMHSSLSPTTLRGYVQIETPEVIANLATQGKTSAHYPLTYPNGNAIKDLAGNPVFSVAPPNYLGPNIVADKNKPVRVKFTNYLPTGNDGNLFIPVDDTYMGAGEGANGQMHTQNRITVHLHGGASPWISDGTPHQWTAPVGEVTTLARGPSVRFVPDMWYDANGQTIVSCAAQLTCAVPGATNDPGQGSLTMYYTNQQSAKFMFYHDHAYGLTRLNVYAGMAAGYILKDAIEDDLINGTNTSGGNPGLAQLPDGMGIPLIIQDKTWVDPAKIAGQDPTWAWGTKPATNTTAAIPTAGDLWSPHVYMPIQHPTSMSGTNDVGRWHYNTWIYPPITTQIIGPVTNLSYVDDITTPNQPPLVPGTPNPTGTPESFMDSVTINGTAWPTLSVTPGFHRFKVLNAANDRPFNLQWFVADPYGLTIISGGTGYTVAPTVTMSGGWKNPTGTETQATVNAVISGVVDSINVVQSNPGYLQEPRVMISGGGGSGATALATLDPAVPGNIIITVTNGGRGYTSAPTVTLIGPVTNLPVATAAITNVVVDLNVVTPPSPAYTDVPTVTITADPSDTTGLGAFAMAAPNAEVKMVPAAISPTTPPTWPIDGRDSGVPDPKSIGPAFTVMANEGGWLPKPQTVAAQPIVFENDPGLATYGTVRDHSLVVGPAERFDTLVDFSQYAGKTIILYNDAPAPYPFFDARYDYYTGSPDNTLIGGAPTILPGYGPNTRTMLQVNVCDPAISDPNSIYNCNGKSVQAFDMAKLNTSWSAVYAKAQEVPLVPNPIYNEVLGTNLPNQMPNLSDTSFTFKPWDPVTNQLSTSTVTIPLKDKAIMENWDMEYGRMNALLGIVLPNQPMFEPFIGTSYFSPPTEYVNPTFQPYPMVGTLGDGTQIWRLDHQGVDQHYMHFHLVNVQVIGRRAIDGSLQPVDPEEYGMKETVRVSPLVNTFIAVRPVQPYLPWKLQNSVRPLDPAVPLGAEMTDSAGLLPNGLGLINTLTDYGMEYVWHCHLLGHEEHDMMRPMIMIMPLTIEAPVLAAGTKGVVYPSVTYTANGGLSAASSATPYTFSISNGVLPPGMRLSAGGVLSGTPTTNGSFTFAVSVVGDTVNSNLLSTITQTLVINNNGAVQPNVTTVTLPNGTVGTAYNQSVTATGGTGPYTYTSTGTLPTGLSLNSAGVIGGIPTTAGTFNFSVIAKDSTNTSSVAKALSITIVDTPVVVSINTTSLPNAILGTAYNQSVTATGGTGPYTYSSTGTLPFGLTLGTDGVISGIPTTEGTFSFSIIAKDSNNVSSSPANYSVTVTNGVALNGVTDLKAEVSDAVRTTVTGETLTWTNTSTGQTGYIVEFAPSTTNTWAVLPGTVSGTTTMSISSPIALAKNVTYSFRVTPTGPNNTKGAVSNIAVIDMKTKPVIPSDLVAVSGTVGNPVNIGLSWTDNSNNNTSFTVQKCNASTPAKVVSCSANKGWSTASTSGVTVGPNVTSVNVSGLQKVNYMLRVISKNAIGSSSASVPTLPTLAQ